MVIKYQTCLLWARAYTCVTVTLNFYDVCWAYAWVDPRPIFLLWLCCLSSAITYYTSRVSHSKILLIYPGLFPPLFSLSRLISMGAFSGKCNNAPSSQATTLHPPTQHYRDSLFFPVSLFFPRQYNADCQLSTFFTPSNHARTIDASRVGTCLMHIKEYTLHGSYCWLYRQQAHNLLQTLNMD